jgi:hypothetical protein
MRGNRPGNTFELPLPDAIITLELPLNRVPGYLGAWVPGELGCWVAGLLGCRIAGLPDCWVAGLLGCRIAGLPDCWVTGPPASLR